MKTAIQGIEPALLWKHFYEISQIPRCSKDEERVRQYVIQVAERNNLSYKLDAVKSVVIRKPATPGKEKAPIVVLQSHLDMVCEKNKDTAHDFTKDAIRLVKDGDWIKADGTTLGADNGIGVAAALAVLESSDLVHGPLEILFTIDEETGLTGALELGDDMLDGRILLNMDTEEDGHICIGCAGGKDTELFLDMDGEAPAEDMVAARVRIGGLQGGHSGVQIYMGLGNAIKRTARFLWKYADELELRLAHIDGGSKHNAIPRECDALVYCPAENLDNLKAAAEAYQEVCRNELSMVDPDIFVRIDTKGFQAPRSVFSRDLQFRLLNMLYTMPHGVLAMSHAVPGLVETSTNLAVIKTTDQHISILTSQRSSVNTSLVDVGDMVVAVGRQAGAEIHQANGYPAWQPNPDSPLLGQLKDVFQEVNGEEPIVEAVHAGLECGIIGDKFDGMDMVSFGPTILGAHSPDERVEISSTKKFWDILVVLLKKLAS